MQSLQKFATYLLAIGLNNYSIFMTNQSHGFEYIVCQSEKFADVARRGPLPASPRSFEGVWRNAVLHSLNPVMVSISVFLAISCYVLRNYFRARLQMRHSKSKHVCLLTRLTFLVEAQNALKMALEKTTTYHRIALNHP